MDRKTRDKPWADSAFRHVPARHARTANTASEQLQDLREEVQEGLATDLGGDPDDYRAESHTRRGYQEDTALLPVEMETVCKAAFMALDCKLRPEFGGTESRGTSIPDIVFQLPWRNDEEREQELPRVLAIVDAKSGTDANFENDHDFSHRREFVLTPLGVNPPPRLTVGENPRNGRSGGPGLLYEGVA